MRALAARLGWPVVRISREPLPHYLWESYLPVMCDRGIKAPSIVRHAAGRAALSIARGLRRLGLRWLPGVPGLALYTRIQRPT